MTTPIRYSAALEQPIPDEAATFAALIDAMRRISATTFRDEGRAIRSVHAKAHGLLHGRLTVLDGLPHELAQGLFAAPAAYDVVLRLSTSPGDLLDDRVSTPRGLAIKILDVPGAQLSGDPADTTQDFLLVDGPVFPAADPKAFVGNVKLLAGTTDKAAGLKRLFSFVARGVEGLIEAAGVKSGTLVGLGGHKLSNPLGETYYSQAPIRYGDHVAKVAVVPLTPEFVALKDAPVDLDSRPDGLREAVSAHFERCGGAWELRVQLCTDLAMMPIEDASIEWPEDVSPYVAVARIDVAPQASWDADKVRSIDDGRAFSPWHGLVAHQPLGGIMRARKPVYDALQAERSARGGCPFAERA